MNLTMLEMAVLEKMCEGTPREADALRCQIENAEVLERQNTGHGFFTTIRPVDTAYLITTRVIDGVFANLEKLNNPMVFVLFMTDGIIDVLEGAAVDENTSNLDFNAMEFKFTVGLI
jgi:hypothetical protein